MAKWPVGPARPTIWTHSIPEYPFLPLTIGFTANYRDRVPYVAIEGQGGSSTPIGIRYNTAPEVVGPYSNPLRYPVLLFKNKD